MFVRSDNRQIRTFAAITALALSALTQAGCYKAHRCAEEACDYGDTDCDGRVDEGFQDELGRYGSLEHCGGCGVSCPEVFPTASETACELDEAGAYRCVLIACPPGTHRSGDGGCAPDLPVTCLPCTGPEDDACERALPGARCVPVTNGDDTDLTEFRCMPPCAGEEDGDDAPACEAGRCVDGLCMPLSGTCTCSGVDLGAEFGCLVVGPSGDRCAGVQICEDRGLGDCAAVLPEVCDGVDDDCDGSVDEDFVDAQGRFAVSLFHCGGCDMPCAPPGPNMVAECVADGATPGGGRCEVACEVGFVDVDGLIGNGCECERFDGNGPPPAVGGDADCDGVPDDDSTFVYVTTTGNDADPGTLVRPMRTVGAALVRAGATGRDVLIASGVYDAPVALVEGVSAFGGYRADFRDRDLSLHPVVLQHTATPGAPVVTCDRLTTGRLDGLEVRGAPAADAGGGSTAIFTVDCGPGVAFSNLSIRAGRGAHGREGDDSSDNLEELDPSLTSLEELEGFAGGAGGRGTSGGPFCGRVSGGAPGTHECGSLDVSGGRGAGETCDRLRCTNGSACGNAGCTDFTVGGVCDFDAVLAAAVPNPSATAGRGLAPGGAGQPTYDAPTNRGVCNFCDDNPTLPRLGQDGRDGAHGFDGAAGVGCGVMGPSLLIDEINGRARGADGTDGSAGNHGSGGGGGSSGGGYAVIGGTSGTCSDQAGGGGGGGGSGGCGAPRAEGGQGGGVSTAVLVRTTASSTAVGPTFEGVRIQTASGGAGGDGGIGAAGGQGGNGAPGGVAPFWCARNGGRGGDGGDGGAGGGGGGGCGGGSHAVLVAGRGASIEAYLDGLRSVIEVNAAGVPGAGGRGGFSPGPAGSAGAPGSADLFAAVP